MSEPTRNEGDHNRNAPRTPPPEYGQGRASNARNEDEKPEASIVYVPRHGDPVSTVWRGKRFVQGVPVVTDDQELIAAARSNTHFNVDGEDKAQDAADRTAKEAADAQAAADGVVEADGKAMELRHEKERNDLEAKQKAEVAAFEHRTKGAEKPRPERDEQPPQQPRPQSGQQQRPPQQQQSGNDYQQR